MSDPVTPTGPEEIFAWGFMIGYLGDVPDVMVEAFPDTDFLEGCPEWLADDPCSREWKRGYEAGVSTFTYHNGDNDE